MFHTFSLYPIKYARQNRFHHNRYSLLLCLFSSSFFLCTGCDQSSPPQLPPLDINQEDSPQIEVDLMSQDMGPSSSQEPDIEFWGGANNTNSNNSPNSDDDPSTSNRLSPSEFGQGNKSCVEIFECMDACIPVRRCRSI